MSNPLYQEMMQNMVPNNILQALSQLRNDPIQFAISQNFNVPYNVGRDPNNIIQYLINSGQITQDQYNQAVQTAQSKYGQLAGILQGMMRR